MCIRDRDIRDLDTLHEAERDYSAVRQAELVGQGVTGDFSFKHLCSIHKHLFSDVYSWAGKTRTVDTVSYTHLDVYKRQATQWRAHFFGNCPPQVWF